MAPPSDAHKKRPPPIELPSTFSPPHRAPGLVPFPVAAERLAREQQDNSQQRRPHTRDGMETPLLKSTGENVERPPKVARSNSMVKFRETATTTWTNVMEQISPRKTSMRKSDQSRGSEQKTPTDGAVAMTSRSRHGRHRPDLSSVGEEHRTLRGEMEKQKERKLHKMMGMVPDTPVDGQYMTNSSQFTRPDQHRLIHLRRFGQHERLETEEQVHSQYRPTESTMITNVC
jgi:hypothetical protein